MKFTIGFIVGAVIGRPVLRVVSRRIDLTRKVQRRFADVVFNFADDIAESLERQTDETAPTRMRSWRKS